MPRKLLISLAALILAVFAFVGYNTYSARHASPLGAAAAPPPGSDPNHSSAAQTPDPTPDATPVHTSAQPSETTPGETSSADRLSAPTTDTIAPNPPNGMTFGGAGHYQLYRQGDLTWRLNTDTGQTCVLFATDEEWRKPKVYRAGCHGRS